MRQFDLNDWLCSKGAFHWMSDEMYLQMRYKHKFGKKLNLENPQTYNEKLQWLKLHDRRPAYTIMVDKYEAKKYVADRIGDRYIIPTLGVWDTFDEIDFDALPDQFVLKCTHDSGGLVICEDKKSFDRASAKKKINKSLSRNYYLHGREWPYKNVKHRIIAEKFMPGFSDQGLIDYKLFCFDGKVVMTLVCSERFSETGLKEDFYDLNWNPIKLKRPDHPNSSLRLPKPKTYDEMLRIAKCLSTGIPFVRVDLYEVEGKLYFGELTFFPNSGFNGFEPEEWDMRLGKELILPTEF